MGLPQNTQVLTSHDLHQHNLTHTWPMPKHKRSNVCACIVSHLLAGKSGSSLSWSNCPTIYGCFSPFWWLGSTCVEDRNKPRKAPPPNHQRTPLHQLCSPVWSHMWFFLALLRFLFDSKQRPYKMVSKYKTGVTPPGVTIEWKKIPAYKVWASPQSCL